MALRRCPVPAAPAGSREGSGRHGGIVPAPATLPRPSRPWDRCPSWPVLRHHSVSSPTPRRPTPMRYALMTEPQQGYSYQDILDAANAAKAAGFETYFRSDHYSSFPGESGQPATDCWTTLAGLARDTTDIGLGSMVSPVTFRIPGSFAKVVATVDEMAGPGRVEMGVGAGWNEEEHAALGIPYPGHRRTGRPPGGGAGHPAWALGRARRLVVRGPALPGPGRALPAPRRAAQPHRRRRRPAALLPPRRDRTRTSTTSARPTRPRCARSWPASTPPARSRAVIRGR